MVLEGDWPVFAVGSAGGVVAELLHWWNLREAPQLPAYKLSPFYWGITIGMILAGGFISWLYFGAQAEGIIAFHVGASTPLILQKLVTSLPETAGARNAVAKPAPSVRNFLTW